VTEVAGPTRTADPVVRVKRWADIQLITIVIVVVGSISAVVFQAPILTAVTLLRPVLLVGLILALGDLLELHGAGRARLVTGLGLVGVAAELGSVAVGLWLPLPLVLYLAVLARLLVPVWLFSVGRLTRQHGALPEPLPRRAMIGAAGQAVLGLSGFFDGTLLLVVLAVGLALAIPWLGFLFGLSGLGRPATDAPSES
jgi:hypothetical protein